MQKRNILTNIKEKKSINLWQLLEKIFMPLVDWPWLKSLLNKKGVDRFAISFGLIVLALNFFCLSYGLLEIVFRFFVYTGCLLGIVYAIYPILLYWLRRVEFDRHLIHGYFLYKVCALVLLMPCVVTPVAQIVTPSTKELVYEDNLYAQCTDTLVLQKDSGLMKDTAWQQAHGYTVSGDTLFMKKNSLPETISNSQVDPPVYWSVYFHFIDPGNQHMTTSPKGRGIAALAAILGVFLLNGLLVSCIIGWVDRRKERVHKGDLDYKLRHLGRGNYAVVIGANEIAASVIRNLFAVHDPQNINFKNEGNNQYVLLQTTHDVEEVRDKLESHLTIDQLDRVLIYRGQRDSIEDLEKLYPEYATEIYVLGEYSLLDGGESFHDAMNMRCVNLLAKHLMHKKESNSNSSKIKRRVCKVLFEYQTTQSVFQFSDATQEVKDNLVFLPFNRYESWARTVMVDNKAAENIVLSNDNVDNKLAEGKTDDTNGDKAKTEEKSLDNGSVENNSSEYVNDDGIIHYTPLDSFAGIKADDDEHVHFVVVGMSKMGVAMGLQAMLQAHYLNFAEAEMGEDFEIRKNKKNLRRTRITFIDTNMDKEINFFMGRYANMFQLMRYRYFDANANKDEDVKWIDPIEANNEYAHLCRGGNPENFIDIELEFVKGELESVGVRSYLEQISNKKNAWVKNSKLTIAICLPKTHEAIAASLYMPIAVYDKAQEIWVYQRESADIVLNLNKTKDLRYQKLRPFGMIYGEFMSDRSLYLKALLVNGAYDLNGTIEYETSSKDSNTSGSNNNSTKYVVDEREIEAAKKDFKGKVILRNMADKETYEDLRETWRELSLDKRLSNKYFADSIYQKLRGVMDAQKYVELCESLNNSTEEGEINKMLDDLKEKISGKKEEKDKKDKEKNENVELLARCEHNRWNVQQLLFGYALCTKEQDYKLRQLDKNRRDNEKEHKNEYKKEKENLKTGVNRIHPNICDYEHLDVVDYEAKGYDKDLNEIIPIVLRLVDRRL